MDFTQMQTAVHWVEAFVVMGTIFFGLAAIYVFIRLIDLCRGTDH